VPRIKDRNADDDHVGASRRLMRINVAFSATANFSFEKLGTEPSERSVCDARTD
jgi:hypothetical protein